MAEKKTILVVDDEEHMRSLIRYNLSRENYDVMAAKDGVEGIEMVKKQKPDLIISDVMMPRMDGYDFCRSMRMSSDTMAIPFIFLTAKGQLPDKIEGLKTGADDYITKPFVPRELVEMVNARLNRVEIYKEMADTDKLTGLLNRRGLDEHLDAEIIRAKRLNIPLSVGMLDVDLFRKINERYGHVAGDEALAKIAAAIRATLGKDGVAGRFGGEEFVVIMPGKKGAAAAEMLESIRCAIEDLSFDDKTMKVSVSIGEACYPNDAGDDKALIERSDQALFKAKSSGRNRVVSYSKAGGEN